MSVLACAIRGTFYIQYETLEELGEGAFGKALKCRRRRDNQIFVVKIMHESKMSAKAIEEVTSHTRLTLTCHMTSHAANSSFEQKQPRPWFQMHRAWMQGHFLKSDPTQAGFCFVMFSDAIGARIDFPVYTNYIKPAEPVATVSFPGHQMPLGMGQ